MDRCKTCGHLEESHSRRSGAPAQFMADGSLTGYGLCQSCPEDKERHNFIAAESS